MGLKIKPKNIKSAFKTVDKLAKDPRVQKAVKKSIELIKDYQDAQKKAKMETLNFKKVFKQTKQAVQKAEKLSKDPKVKQAIKTAEMLVKEYKKTKNQQKMETLKFKNIKRKAKKAGQAVGHGISQAGQAVVHTAQNKNVQKGALNAGKFAYKAGQAGAKYAQNHPNQVQMAIKMASMAA